MPLPSHFSFFQNYFSKKSSRKPRNQAVFRRLELLTLEERITPTAFTVSTLADSGVGSLRQAIIEANASDANPDTIGFGVSGTITLQSTLPNINNAAIAGTLAINGPGPSELTINGDNGKADRNFNIFNIVEGGDLTISGVTVSGARAEGDGGGGFRNSGTLKIANSTLSHNTSFNKGGALFNTGTLTVSNSTLSGNSAIVGGGILNYGTLNISESTLSGNNASRNGGAIFNSGQAKVTNSTLFDNTALTGGGIVNDGTLTISNSTLFNNSAAVDGGAIANFGTLNISNSTLSGNKAVLDGGGIFSSGMVNVYNSTISANSAAKSGGGIRNHETLTIANTIIANNTGGDYSSLKTSTVKLIEFATKENNLVTQGNFNWATTVTNDNLKLGPLQFNGGPTKTMALLRGSIAIGAGNAEISNRSPINGLDQRGFSRATSDIGAVTFNNLILVSNTNNSGDGSLRAAIDKANNTPFNDSIGFTFAEGTITLDSAFPNIKSEAISGALTINGPGASKLTISGDNGNQFRDFSIFIINTGGNLTISRVTVSGAITYNRSGALYNGGTLNIENSTLSGNTSFRLGGAIFNSGTLTISKSTLSGNTAIVGGAIYNFTTTISYPTFSDGTFGTFSTINPSTVVIANSTLSGNTARDGGAIFNSGTLTISNSTLSGNSAISNGGGILNHYIRFSTSTINIANTIIANSTSGGDYSGDGIIGVNTNNLVEDGSITGGGTISGDPLLGPLQNNGGPTKTMALLSGSVAIGAGNADISNASPINGLDQRGKTRSSTKPSIGAYEFLPASQTVSPLVTLTKSPPSSNGSTTLPKIDRVTGEIAGTFVPIEGNTGTLDIESGDFDNDGDADFIVGAAKGNSPVVGIFDSQTGEKIKSIQAFDPAFQGGVSIAVGDVNNDGTLDIIAGAGLGGGPHVKIFSGKNLQEIASFFAYDDAFMGGVSVGCADINGDGILDIVTGAGPGGSPHVKVFDGATLSVISQWFAYDKDFLGGVFVAVGDIGNDGKFEVVTGAGAGGGPVVAVFDPFTGALQTQFFAYAEAFTGGVRVGVIDFNEDGILDIVTGAGPGGGPHVKVFNYPQFDLLDQFFAGPMDDLGGVFVS